MLLKLTTLISICLATSCNNPAKQEILPRPENLNGNWLLVSVSPDTADLKKAFIKKWPYININYTKKTIGGYSGCNSFGGEFILKKHSITIGNLMTTEMACPGSIEPTLYKNLKSINRYQVSKDSLKLYAQETMLLSFVRKAGPVE
jgi:heat shock protein HslJ